MVRDCRSATGRLSSTRWTYESGYNFNRLKVKCIQRSKASPTCVYLFPLVRDFACALLTDAMNRLCPRLFAAKGDISSAAVAANTLLRAVEETARLAPSTYDRRLISSERAFTEIARDANFDPRFLGEGPSAFHLLDAIDLLG